MKQIAKLIVIDEAGEYLMLRRSGHPHYPNDPDLPGGTVEDSEQPLQGLVREVLEETGIAVGEGHVHELYNTATYSPSNSQYLLYEVTLDKRPQVIASWEHSSYEWLAFDTFIQKVQTAADPYMHLVYDVLCKHAT